MSAAMPVPQRDAEHLPEPSAELILIVALTRVYLRQIKRKRDRLQFLREVSEDLDVSLELSSVIRIRPASRDAEVLAARKQANAFWAQALGLIVSRMD